MACQKKSRFCNKIDKIKIIKNFIPLMSFSFIPEKYILEGRVIGISKIKIF